MTISVANGKEILKEKFISKSECLKKMKLVSLVSSCKLRDKFFFFTVDLGFIFFSKLRVENQIFFSVLLKPLN